MPVYDYYIGRNTHAYTILCMFISKEPVESEGGANTLKNYGVFGYALRRRLGRDLGRGGYVTHSVKV